MGTAQRVLGLLSIGLCVAVLLGLWWRRRLSITYSWGAYLAGVALSDTLISAWRATFWTWGFWTAKELALGLLKLGIGLEIGALAFRRFPGARRVAVRLAVLALGLTAVALLATSRAAAPPGLASFALEAHARLSHATAMLFVSLGLLVLWYRVPVHRLHRAILRGLATYLLVFSAVTRAAFDLLLPESRKWWEALTKIDGLAYVAMLAYWAWEAWRVDPDDDLRGSAAIESRLAWRERADEPTPPAGELRSR